MKKAFFEFMGHVLGDDSPFHTFSVSTYRTFIDVVFDGFTMIRPEQLGWINTHLVGGCWWLSAEEDSIRLIIRFEDTEND